MVVRYASSADGSWKSFFLVTPRVLFHCRGSVIPSVLPQVVIAVGLSFVSLYYNPLSWLPEDARPWDAFNVMSFLLSFLLVFKTQSAYNQHWTAITHLEKLMAVYRELGISACTTFDWEKSPEIKGYSRKVLRLIVLHFNVMLEYFRRSGTSCTDNKKVMNLLREDIKLVTGPNEYRALYPLEAKEVLGSESRYPFTNPIVVVFWLDRVIANCFKAGGVLSPPHGASMSQQTSQLLNHFKAMDQIDKTQFPLPYAQLVKWLITMWVFMLPFVLQLSTYAFTPVAMFVIALAMFGLDEVAEILESPFGVDPNDIYLEQYREDLVQDLELMFYGREMKVDQVFTDDNELCLRGISEEGNQVSASWSVNMESRISGTLKKRLSEKGRPPTPEDTRMAFERDYSRCLARSMKGACSRMSTQSTLPELGSLDFDAGLHRAGTQFFDEERPLPLIDEAPLVTTAVRIGGGVSSPRPERTPHAELVGRLAGSSPRSLGPQGMHQDDTLVVHGDSRRPREEVPPPKVDNVVCHEAPRPTPQEAPPPKIGALVCHEPPRAPPRKAPPMAVPTVEAGELSRRPERTPHAELVGRLAGSSPRSLGPQGMHQDDTLVVHGDSRHPREEVPPPKVDNVVCHEAPRSTPQEAPPPKIGALVCHEPPRAPPRKAPPMAVPTVEAGELSRRPNSAPHPGVGHPLPQPRPTTNVPQPRSKMTRSQAYEAWVINESRAARAAEKQRKAAS